MKLVALTTLAAEPEVEARLLAKDLGCAAYDAGQLLRGVLPSVVLRTDDVARADALCAALHARGHGALVCDAASVASHRAMDCPQRFWLEPTGLRGSPPETTLLWGDVVALVRATHAVEFIKLGIERGRAFSAGKAVLTGGLLLTKATEKETRARATEKEPVLYLFRRDGPPWLLAESRLKYDGLGALLKPGQQENFQTLARVLRERCPGALFDDRLLQFRGGPSLPNTPDSIDLLAHLIVLAFAPKPVS